MCGGAVEKTSHGDLIRIATELGNISLNPGQEELFWPIPKASAFSLKESSESEGQEPQKSVGHRNDTHDRTSRHWQLLRKELLFQRANRKRSRGS